jgi:hypothetical protein
LLSTERDRSDRDDSARDREDDEADPEDCPWRSVKLLGPTVYYNAAPFLRISDPTDVHESDFDTFCAKDAMRVHPRDEEALHELACAALDRPSDEQHKFKDDPLPLALQNRNKVRGLPPHEWICMPHPTAPVATFVLRPTAGHSCPGAAPARTQPSHANRWMAPARAL